MTMPVIDAIETLSDKRLAVPDHDPELSVIDSVLVPLSAFLRNQPVLEGPVDAPKTISPQKMEIMLQDVTDEELHTSVAEVLGLDYLSAAAPPQPTDGMIKYAGVLYGQYCRPIVSMPVQVRSTCLNVFFLVDTGSPFTFLSSKALHALGFTEHVPDRARVTLGGYSKFYVQLSPLEKHFKDINVLGADFLERADAELNVKYKEGFKELTLAYAESSP